MIFTVIKLSVSDTKKKRVPTRRYVGNPNFLAMSLSVCKGKEKNTISQIFSHKSFVE